MQRKNPETGYFICWPLKQFCRIFKIVGCIPEVLTLHLTPILKYIFMSNARCHICHICHIWQIWHLCHLAFDTHIYVNMGVKRSVRTSGTQPTILNILKNCLQGPKLEYPVSWFFLCIFQNFLCIFCESRGSIVYVNKIG